ncbi:MAG TPA: phasin family protein [Bradyrhizobium sp.]|nr:phasin family protein [Bradyrhizobium sp.]
MSKTRSRRPASDMRGQRRSLVELTQAMSRAVDDAVLVAPAGLATAATDRLPRSEPAVEKPGRVERASSDSAAEMLVKIAKDYQNRLLDNVRDGLNAALDQARDFAEAGRASERDGDTEPTSDLMAAVGAATAVYRAEALELMQANVAGALNFARELAGARSAAEFIELSGAHARKSCELMLKQADAMKSVAEAVAKQRDRN